MIESPDFDTHGTARFENGKLVSHESVTGGANGITEVEVRFR